MTTMDPRYPIGPFTSVSRPLTAEERGGFIDAIAAHPSNLRSAVAGLTDAQLDMPYRDEGWTVRQVVHHMVDSHVNSYVRFKLAVTEDAATIGTYDEAAWAELADARDAPVEGSLAILDAIHGRWVAFLRALTSDQFRREVRHPEIGGITVDVLLEIYGWHCPHHEGHVTALRTRMDW